MGRRHRVRYRPTLTRIPTEANLRRARKQLQELKARIANGTFRFAEDFPDFLHIDRLAARADGESVTRYSMSSWRTHSRASTRTISPLQRSKATARSLDAVWRPAIGDMYFDEVKKKTHNNIVSAVRCAFEYGYRDQPERNNPAAGTQVLPPREAGSACSRSVLHPGCRGHHCCDP